MEIPAILYGTYPEVKARCKKLLARYLKQQGSLLELLESEGLYDTRQRHGDIALEGPDRYIVGSSPNYQCFALVRFLTHHMPATLDIASRQVRPHVLDALLERPWGVLCLLDNNNMNCLFPDDNVERYRRYLRAVLRCWNEVSAEDGHYASGPLCERTAWMAGPPIRKALFFLGVPQSVLSKYRDAIPNNDLAAFVVAHTNPALAGDLLELAREQLERPRLAPPAVPPLPPPRAQDKPARVVHKPSPAMVAAVRAADPATVQRLIEAGEPVDVVIMDPEVMASPLDWAARGGYIDLLSCILARDPRTELEDLDGDTPLMLAAQGGHLEAVRVLLKHGANPNAVTNHGWSALAYAREFGHAEVLALLEQAYAPEILARNHEEFD